MKSTAISMNKYWVRNLSVFMGLIYLLQPLHQPLESAMHAVSHFIDQPAHIIGHSQEEIAVHYVHEHQREISRHKHLIVELFSELLDPIKDKRDSFPISEILKLDKYLTSASTAALHAESNKGYLLIVRAFGYPDKGHLLSPLKPPISAV